MGLTIATSLFKLIGPRRAKTLAQVMSAVIGAFIFVIAQVRNLVLLNGRHGTALTDKVNAYTQAMMKFAHSDLFAPDQPAAWLARALMGEWKIGLIMLGASALLFLVVVQIIGRRFAADAAAAAGVGSGRPKVAKGGVRGFEGGPFRATVRKEMRLLLRDPALISQVLLRVLYILPLGFAVWGVANGVSKLQLTSATFLVFITSQLAGTMAWIMVSAEDALELIATAPVRAGMMRRAKLTAAMLPVILIIAAPLAGLIYVAPVAGLATTAGCLCAAISACLIAVWYEKPARRQDLRRRRSASLVGAIAEFLVGICWSAAVGAAVAIPLWSPIPVVVALIILIAIRKPQRSFAEVLAAQ
jgi:ABC-2 type transport system permease protein